MQPISGTFLGTEYVSTSPTTQLFVHLKVPYKHITTIVLVLLVASLVAIIVLAMLVASLQGTIVLTMLVTYGPGSYYSGH